MLLGNSIGPGLVITHNIFGGGNVFSVPLDNSTAVTVEGVSIESNSFSGQTGAGTKATLTQTFTNNQTQWLFNFCPQLVFPTIATVDVNFLADAGFPRVVARPPSGCSVTVESDVAFTGSVTVKVDSSRPSPELI